MGRAWRYRIISILLILSWFTGLFASIPARAALVPEANFSPAEFPQAIDALSVLEGTVSSLGYCDANPAPLEGALVSIETNDGQTDTRTTDEFGAYTFEFELELETSLTITAKVTAPDHAAGSVSEIIVEAGAVTTQDFGLRWLMPCTQADPTLLEVTLEAGQTTTRSIRLNNTGAASTQFAITEHAGTFTPFPESSPELTQEIVIGDAAWTHSDLPAGLTVYPALARPDNELMLTQSLSQLLIAGNSISCNAGGYHTENSYWRIFDLADYAITHDFAVSRVEIGIEQAVGAGGSQSVTVNLYTIGNDLNWDNLVLLNSVDVTVADTTLAILNIPIPTLVPAGSLLVVEFLTPDGLVLGNSLFVGSNDKGQTGPTYLTADECNVYDPLPTEALGFPDMHLVMNVYGDISLVDPGDVAWLKQTPLEGMVTAGGSFDIEVLFTPAYTLTAGTYTSLLQIATDDPENNPLQIPVTMNIIDHNLSLTADSVYITGDPGSVVTYALTLTNSSLGVTDSFSLSVLDADFKTTLNSTSTPQLEPGESFTFEVEVVVGSLTDHLLFDTIKVLAIFQADPFYRTDIALTTRIRTLDLYLPMVMLLNSP